MGSYLHKRRGERVEVQLPVDLDNGRGISRNISQSGIYFLTDRDFSEGATFRFTLALEYAIPGRRVELSCQARVIRIEPQGDQVGIAAQIEDLTETPFPEDVEGSAFPETSSLH